jgi:hypothetical protein
MEQTLQMTRKRRVKKCLEKVIDPQSAVICDRLRALLQQVQDLVQFRFVCDFLVFKLVLNHFVKLAIATRISLNLGFAPHGL